MGRICIAKPVSVKLVPLEDKDPEYMFQDMGYERFDSLNKIVRFHKKDKEMVFYFSIVNVKTEKDSILLTNEEIEAAYKFIKERENGQNLHRH